MLSYAPDIYILYSFQLQVGFHKTVDSLAHATFPVFAGKDFFARNFASFSYQYEPCRFAQNIAFIRNKYLFCTKLRINFEEKS